MADSRGTRDDVSSRMLIAIRDYAAMKLGAPVAHQTFEMAVRDAEGGVVRATDPRAWVPLEVLESVHASFEDLLGPAFLIDAATWVVPARRDLSAMSLSALTTPQVFYEHIDRARSFFARHIAFEPRREKPGRYAIDLRYREDVPKSRVTCLVAKGVLHSVPLLFDLPPATVSEGMCRNDGADRCRYTVEFRSERPTPLYGFGIGALIATCSAAFRPSVAWALAPIVGWLVGREILHARRARFMTRVTEEQRRVLAENEADFQRRFDELTALNELLEQRSRTRDEALPAGGTQQRTG